MFKELWVLVKMLFASKPSEARARGKLDIKVMKHFPFSGYRYMMWCGVVITKDEKLEVIKRFLTTKAGKVSEVHEFGHCIQAESEHGDNWIRYYLNYFWHWIKHNPLVKPASACYYVNRYECEAYAQEEHPDYWVYYTRDNLRGKYSIKDAKKIFKHLGGKNEWKKYVKGL